MKRLFQGILLLTVAAFLGECLEFFINMTLAKQLGEEGLGHYMSILPIIFFIVIIASLELPVSLSKVIAENEREYHKSTLLYTMKWTIVLTSFFVTIGWLVFTVLPLFSSYHPLVRWLMVLLIPIVAFSSLSRGYFMGIGKLGKIAFSNFLRKVAQLLLLVLVFRFYDFSNEAALFVALCILIASESAVFLYLIQAYFLHWKSFRGLKHKHINPQEVGKALLAVSVPTTFLRVFHAVSHAIQPFLIKATLIQHGLQPSQATEQFGLLAGVAMTIGFFPGFIAHSLLVALIPAVSEAVSKDNRKKILMMLKSVLWGTTAYSIPVVLIYYYFGESLTNMFYTNTEATRYLQLLWPYFLIHFFVLPLQAFLIGFGLVKDALYHTIWATIVSFTVLYVLGSKTDLGMSGIIIGLNTGGLLLLLLHLYTLKVKLKISTPWGGTFNRFS
ncbi:oligosaccharide flippase family protein [Bacillus sp. 2205SS5-2]|uniref:oligosaccharide flippase family protein n=1 Tax=Bacillus sp. 2205SS5-2 TaxID=3109031 RepID=UPI0030056CA2